MSFIKRSPNKTNQDSSKNRLTLNLVKVVSIALAFCVLRFTIGSKLDQQIEASMIGFGYTARVNVKSALNPIGTIGNNETFGDADSTLLQENLKSTSITQGKTNLVTVDPRILAMRNFLIDYNSPMYPYAEDFIKEADKYGLDWRLVASISCVEAACGNLIPYQSYNAWGWKGAANGDFSHFSSWPEGIQVITAGISLGYGVTITPFQMESTYCPPCGLNPRHEWANGVTYFMNQLAYYLENPDNN